MANTDKNLLIQGIALLLAVATIIGSVNLLFAGRLDRLESHLDQNHAVMLQHVTNSDLHKH